MPPPASATGLLNRNMCLPPVGKPLTADMATTSEPAKPHLPASTASSFRFSQFLKETKDETASQCVSGRRSKYDTDKSRVVPLSSVKEDEPVDNEADGGNDQEVLEAILQQAKSHRKWDYSTDMLLRDSFSARKKSAGASLRDADALSVTTDSNGGPAAVKKTVEPLWSESSTVMENTGRTSQAGGGPSVKRQLSLNALADSLNKPPPSAASSRRGEKAGRVILESLNPSEEMRVMSGLLTTYVQSATKSRDARRTPDSRLLVCAIYRRWQRDVDIDKQQAMCC